MVSQFWLLILYAFRSLFPSLREEQVLGRDPSRRFFPVIIGIMLFLLVSAVATGVMIDRATRYFAKGLTSGFTVQIVDGRHNPERVAAVVRLLQDFKGISEVRVLPVGEVDALLTPWLGSIGLEVSLPLPAVIDLRRAEGQAIDLPALNKALAALAPGAHVEDHQQFLGPLIAFGGTLKSFSFFAVMLIAIASLLITVYITTISLRLHQEPVSLLHLIGATDTYIVRLIQIRFARLSLIGGMVGTGGAIILSSLVDFSAVKLVVPFLVLDALSYKDMFFLLLLPCLITLLCVAMVGFTVRRYLGRSL